MIKMVIIRRQYVHDLPVEKKHRLPDLRFQRINRHEVFGKFSNYLTVLEFLLELEGFVEFLGLRIQNSVHLE